MDLWDPPIVPSSRKKAVKSKKKLVVSACGRLSEMAPSRPKAKSIGPKGFPCCTPPFARDTRRISRRKQERSIWLKALQVHGQEAPFLVVVVLAKPASDGVNAGFTVVCGPEPRCVGLRYRVMFSDTVDSWALAVSRRRVSPTATGWWPPSFFFS